jgi:hypothetical protein
MNGAERIASERQRQIEKEGWTPEHDSQHTNGSLARSGACYAAHASVQAAISGGSELGCGSIKQCPIFVHEGWPWSYDYWKPSPDPIRNLEKAGALIAAEIDRLLRAESRTPQGKS